MSGENERVEDRESFESKYVTLLTCSPGSLRDLGGESCTVITVVGHKSGDIEHLSINLKDSRELAVRILASLYTADDEFAEKVLEVMFPIGDDGHPHWPKEDQF